MKCIVWLGCFLMTMGATFGSSPSTDFSQLNKPATIKVLLHKQEGAAVVEVKGHHYVYNPLNGQKLAYGAGNKRFAITCNKSGIQWGEKFPEIYQLRFVPGDSQSYILVNGIQYKGCVEVYYDNGSFNVVNEVDVESYLKAILSVQIQAPLHEEVLTSMAIIERTRAYFQSKKDPSSYWHVSAEDVHYPGAAFSLQPPICHAVDMTRQAVLTFGGNFFPALYTENSAGKTVDFTTIFRKNVSAPCGVAAPVAAQDRLAHQWQCSILKEELAHRVGVDRIVSMELYVKTDKVYGVKITGESSEKDVDFINFQQMIGKNDLLSNDFTVEVRNNDVVFHGFGGGCGVGLCLYSAKILAEKGQKAPQILQTFFPDTKLEKMRSW